MSREHPTFDMAQQPLFAPPATCRACKATDVKNCRWELDNRHLPAAHRDRCPKTCLTPRYDPSTAPLPEGF